MPEGTTTLSCQSQVELYTTSVSRFVGLLFSYSNNFAINDLKRDFPETVLPQIPQETADILLRKSFPAFLLTATYTISAFRCQVVSPFFYVFTKTNPVFLM